ncbi:MAG TPA: hypothetical protein VHG09_05200, partial [Longimicrobiales bacterium]|nr:hypothetical protein [Longimicrobiales bacterium]
SNAPIFLTIVLGFGALGTLWSFWRRPRDVNARQGTRVSIARAFGTVRKWARALSGNVLWAVLFLPAVIALACSTLALISYCFFHLPFMRAVRIPGAVQRSRRGATGASSWADGGPTGATGASDARGSGDAGSPDAADHDGPARMSSGDTSRRNESESVAAGGG